MFIFSIRLTSENTRHRVCDDSLSLQNILQTFPRIVPKIILQRAEYIFPALKNSLVSVFVFVRMDPDYALLPNTR